MNEHSDGVLELHRPFTAGRRRAKRGRADKSSGKAAVRSTTAGSLFMLKLRNQFAVQSTMAGNRGPTLTVLRTFRWPVSI